MASNPTRVLSSLMLGLLLALAACKTDLEDLPEVDPVDDPWVDAIETEEPIAAAPALVVATNDTPAPAPGPVAIDPALAGTPDPATVEAAKLAGGSTTTSTSTTSKSIPTTADPSAPVDPAAPAPELAPVDLAPAPAVEPAAAEPVKPAAPAPITMADYAGTFRFTGGSSQEQAVAEAIEFGAEQVVLIARGIARKRLTKTQIIEDPVTITVTGDDLKLSWGTSGDSMTCVIDGPSTTMSYKGDKYKGRARAKDGKLITSFQGPDATKTVVYVLSSDRKTLTVHHKLVADQLQEPVTFKLTYSRK